MFSLITLSKNQRLVNLVLRRSLHLKPEFDWQYLSNPQNCSEIEKNINLRKGVGDIKALQNIYHSDKQNGELLNDLASLIPNQTHRCVPIGDEPKIIKEIGKCREFNGFKGKTFIDLAYQLNCIRTDHTGHSTGQRTYYLKDSLSLLETAVIRFTIDQLLSKGFKLVSVPDIINSDIIEACGFSTKSNRSQVYHIDNTDNQCLSGTGEMPLAGLNINKEFESKDLPEKLVTVSRCFRAETSSLEDHHGIYRVHQFYKVEMFAISESNESDKVLEEFKEIEIELFTKLGLHFRVMDMPSHELGAPASRKYDIETYLPVSDVWAEISSTSNCTDYQARRLSIKHDRDFAHTINGTACAVPRLLIAIFENYQTEDGSVRIPECLQAYMNNKTEITRSEETEISWKRITNKSRNKNK